MLKQLLFPETQAIIDALGDDNVRFVGGCVRDLIAGLPVKDIDLATKWTPEQVIYHLKKAEIQVIPTGIKHGTVTAYFSEEKKFEITTLRRDVATDGRHAEVSFVDEWELDAQRRDFTINALYLSASAKVLDFFGGIDHLRNGKVLFIGDPDQRIREDYLRILRFFRFFAKFGRGNPDETAARACSRHAAQVNYLSGERIQAEMFKILELNNCAQVLTHMQNYGILPFIFPGEVSFQSLQNLIEINPDAPLLRRLAVIEGYNLQILSDHWRLSGEQIRVLKAISTNIDLNEPKRVMRHLGRDGFLDVTYIAAARGTLPHKLDEMLAFANNWRIPKFPIYGGDVIAMGVKEGRAIGQILTRIEEYWEAHNYIFTRDELMKRLRVEVNEYHSREKSSVQ